MKLWLLVSTAASLFIGWAYCHTDEVSVIFALLGLLGFAAGFAFPRFWWLTWLPLGIACPIDEVLIGQHILHAPFTGGQPAAACVAFVPALLACAMGRFSRKQIPARLQ